jgi:hypothetical protein
MQKGKDQVHGTGQAIVRFQGTAAVSWDGWPAYAEHAAMQELSGPSLIPFLNQNDIEKARKRRHRCTFYVLRGADDAADKDAV